MKYKVENKSSMDKTILGEEVKAGEEKTLETDEELEAKSPWVSVEQIEEEKKKQSKKKTQKKENEEQKKSK